MAILVNKIIHIHDCGAHYNRLEFENPKSIHIDHSTGDFGRLVPPSAKLKLNEPLDFKISLFNKAGNAKIIEDIGQNGLLYLELKKGAILNEIFVEPDSIFTDVRYGNDSLIYSFYNSGANDHISLSLSVELDNQNAYLKIKANKTDLEWRQYFIKKALRKPNVQQVDKSNPIIRELMTADQVAEYLQVKKKTIQNWTSKGTIPHCHIGGTVRYKKNEIDRELSKK